jgi:hypothetical protein
VGTARYPADRARRRLGFLAPVRHLLLAPVVLGTAIFFITYERHSSPGTTAAAAAIPAHGGPQQPGPVVGAPRAQRDGGRGLGPRHVADQPPDRFSVPRPARSLRGDVASTAVWLLAWIVTFQLPVAFAIVVIDKSVDASLVTAARGFGLGTGLGCVVDNASVLYAASLAWWALRGRLPWRLIRFLDDAHRRGVLRQTGAVHRFRHADLQRHLAESG